MEKSHKIIISISLVLLIIIAGLYLNVCIKRNSIKNYTEDYIVSQGYPIERIKKIDIMHSYINQILSYNEWRISVEFEKKPDMFFWFTYKEGKIIYQGVSSEPMMDKDKVIEYSEKFKNGTLLDD